MLIKERSLGRGSFKDVSLKDARLARDAARLRVKGDRSTPGVGIVQERRAAREDCESRRWPSSLKRYAYPTIGKLTIPEIKPSHVYELLQPIREEKRETGNRLRGRIETIIAKNINVDDTERNDVGHGLVRLLIVVALVLVVAALINTPDKRTFDDLKECWTTRQRYGKLQSARRGAAARETSASVTGARASFEFGQVGRELNREAAYAHLASRSQRQISCQTDIRTRRVKQVRGSEPPLAFLCAVSCFAGCAMLCGRADTLIFLFHASGRPCAQPCGRPCGRQHQARFQTCRPWQGSRSLGGHSRRCRRE